MQEIIKISQTIIGNDEANSVNARDIHTYLGVKTVFANWIDRAIKKYDFKENIDFIKVITDSKSGKRDFIVTLDMAKELSMLENNAKGKETRKYFISCEKKVLSGTTNDNLTPVLNIMLKQNETVLRLLEQLISTQETQIKTYNIYKGVKNLINIKTMKGGIKL